MKNSKDEVLDVSTDRIGPAPVKPVIENGILYESNSEPGVVSAKNEKDKKLIWHVKVVNPFISSDLEKDVQEVYITSMAMDDDKKTLVIEDELGIKYVLDVSTKKIRLLKWPVSIKLLEKKLKGDKWDYSVELRIKNHLNRTIKFDKPSVAHKNRLENNLFEVWADEKVVQYSGIMKSRVPPDDFLELKKGDTYSVNVNLAEHYPLPAATKKVKIQFSHTNHFSPDGFRMYSAPITINLND